MEVLIPLFVRSPAFRGLCVWSPAFRRSSLLLAVAMALAVQSLIPCATFGQVRPPEHVKAAFLYNFTRFVDWPPTAFPSADSPLIIGVADDEDTAAALETMVKDEKVRNRRLELRRCRSPKEIDSCHLLYISSDGRARRQEFIQAAKGHSMLTVGDSSEFLREGGMIQFVTGRTVKLRIHLPRAREASLTISSQLLRLAEVENK